MERIRKLTGLLVAFFVTILAASGVFYSLDCQLGDLLYQNWRRPDERIFIVGIDSYAMEEIGTWPWDRAIAAEIIETLNQDPENRPAAIGLDVVYADQRDRESDERLARAASAGNVAAACMVEIESSMILESDGSAYMDEFSSGYVSEPYDALRKEVRLGHINAMYDRDGVLRRHLWSVDTEEGETLLSLPYRLYELYCENQGLEPDFVPETDSRGFWRVEFSGRPGDYYYCSAADILYGTYDPDMLKDAIVLIGPYEMGMSDDFVTAADRAERMYGVEYLANVTACMLNNRQKQEVENGIQLLALFLLTFTGTCLYTKGRLGWILAGGAGTLILAIISLRLVYEAGYLLHPLWFLAGMFIVFLYAIIERYIQEAAERKHIRKTFERYVDPEIIRELLKRDISEHALTGKTTDIAVMFADIRGFTTLSEQMRPEEIVQILNEYLTLTSTCIKKRKGTLDKFIGDCTMAFWGAPLSCEDPVYQACRAAMDMLEKADEMKEKLQRRFGKTVSFGIGIHYGPAVVGNIGAETRMDYTVIGDTVNTASRLESNAPAGTIYISRKAADMLGSRAVTEELPNKLLLKGKTEEFEVLILKELK